MKAPSFSLFVAISLALAVVIPAGQAQHARDDGDPPGQLVDRGFQDDLVERPGMHGRGDVFYYPRGDEEKRAPPTRPRESNLKSGYHQLLAHQRVTPQFKRPGHTASSYSAKAGGVKSAEQKLPASDVQRLHEALKPRDLEVEEDVSLSRRKPKTSVTIGSGGPPRNSNAQKTLFVSGRLEAAKARKAKKEARKTAGTYVTGGGSSTGGSGQSISAGHTTATAAQSVSAGHTTASTHSTGSAPSTTTAKSTTSSTSATSSSSTKGKEKQVAQRRSSDALLVKNLHAETRDTFEGEDALISRMPKHVKTVRQNTRQGDLRNDDVHKFVFHSGRLEEAKARKAKKEARKNAGTYVTGGGSSTGASGQSASSGHSTASAHQTVSAGHHSTASAHETTPAGHTTVSAHSTGLVAKSTTSTQSTMPAPSTKSAPSSTSGSSSKGKGKGKEKQVAQRGLSQAPFVEHLHIRDILEGGEGEDGLISRMPKHGKSVTREGPPRESNLQKFMFVGGRLEAAKARKANKEARKNAGTYITGGQSSTDASGRSTPSGHSTAAAHHTTSAGLTVSAGHTASADHATTSAHSTDSAPSTTAVKSTPSSTSAVSSSSSIGKGKDEQKGKQVAQRELSVAHVVEDLHMRDTFERGEDEHALVSRMPKKGKPIKTREGTQRGDEGYRILHVSGRLEEAKARKAKKEARKNAGTYITGGESSTGASGQSTPSGHPTAAAHHTVSIGHTTPSASAHSTGSAPSTASATLSSTTHASTTKSAPSSTSASSSPGKGKGKDKGKQVAQRALSDAPVAEQLHVRDDALVSRMPKNGKDVQPSKVTGKLREDNLHKLVFVSGRLEEAKARKAKKEARKTVGTHVTGGGSSTSASGHSTPSSHSTAAAHHTASAGHTTATAHSTSPAPSTTAVKSTTSASSTKLAPSSSSASSSTGKSKGKDKEKQVKQRALRDAPVAHSGVTLERGEGEHALISRGPKNAKTLKQNTREATRPNNELQKLLSSGGRFEEAKARKAKKEARKNAGTYVTGGGSSSTGGSGHSTSSGHSTAAAHHTMSAGHTASSAKSTTPASSTKSAPSSTSATSSSSSKGKGKEKQVAQRDLPNAEVVEHPQIRSTLEHSQDDNALNKRMPKGVKTIKANTREGSQRNHAMHNVLFVSGRLEEAKARKAKKEARKSAGTSVTGGGSTSSGHSTASAGHTVSAGHTTASPSPHSTDSASSTAAAKSTMSTSSTKSAPSSTSASSSSSSKGKDTGKQVLQREVSDAQAVEHLRVRDTLERGEDDDAFLGRRKPKNKMVRSSKQPINFDAQRNAEALKTVFVSGRLEEAKARKAKKEARKNAGTYVTGASSGASGHSMSAGHSTSTGQHAVSVSAGHTTSSAAAHSAGSAPSTAAGKSTAAASTKSAPSSASATLSSSSKGKKGKDKGKQVVQRELLDAPVLGDLGIRSTLGRRDDEPALVSRQKPKNFIKSVKLHSNEGSQRGHEYHNVLFVSGRLEEAKARKAKKEARKSAGTYITGSGSSSGASGHSTSAGQSTSTGQHAVSVSAGHTTTSAHSTGAAVSTTSVKSTTSASSATPAPSSTSASSSSSKGKGKGKGKQVAQRGLRDAEAVRYLPARDALEREEDERASLGRRKPRVLVKTTRKPENEGAQRNSDAQRTIFVSGRLQEAQARKAKKEARKNAGTYVTGGGSSSGASGHSAVAGHSTAAHHTTAGHSTASAHHTTSAGHTTASGHSTGAAVSTTSAKSTTSAVHATKSAPSSTSTSSGTSQSGKGKGKGKGKGVAQRGVSEDDIRANADHLLERDADGDELTARMPRNRPPTKKIIINKSTQRNMGGTRAMFITGRLTEKKAKKDAAAAAAAAAAEGAGGSGASSAAAHSHSTTGAHAGHQTSSTTTSGTPASHRSSASKAATTAAHSTTSAPSSTTTTTTSAPSSSTSKGKSKDKGKKPARRELAEANHDVGNDLDLDRREDTGAGSEAKRSGHTNPQSSNGVYHSLRMTASNRPVSGSSGSESHTTGAGTGTRPYQSLRINASNRPIGGTRERETTGTTTGAGGYRALRMTASNRPIGGSSTSTASTSHQHGTRKRTVAEHADEAEVLVDRDAADAHDAPLLTTRMPHNKKGVKGRKMLSSQAEMRGGGIRAMLITGRLSEKKAKKDAEAAAKAAAAASGAGGSGASSGAAHSHSTAGAHSSQLASSTTAAGTKPSQHSTASAGAHTTTPAPSTTAAKTTTTTTTAPSSSTSKGKGKDKGKKPARREVQEQNGADGVDHDMARRTADAPLLIPRMPNTKKGIKSKKVVVNQADQRNQSGGLRAMMVTGRLTEKKAKKDAAAAAKAAAASGAGGSGASSTTSAHSTTTTTAPAMHSFMASAQAHAASADRKTTTTSSTPKTTSAPSTTSTAAVDKGKGKAVDKGKGKAPKRRSLLGEGDGGDGEMQERDMSRFADPAFKQDWIPRFALLRRNPPREKTPGPSAKHLNQAKTHLTAKQPLSQTLKTVGPSEKYDHVPKKPAKPGEKAIPDLYRHLMQKKLKPAEKGVGHRPVPDPHA